MLPGDSVRGHDITMRSVTARTTAELFQPYHNMKMWRGYVMVRSKEVGGEFSEGAVETSRGGGGNEHKQLKPHWNGCGTLRGYDTALINVYGVPQGQDTALIVYRQEFITQWRAHGLDVLICPILGPALTLGYPGKLSSAVSYTILYNLVDFPAGVLPVTTVTREDEEALKTYEGHHKDFWDKLLKKAMTDSVGLPVAIQCVALPWQEEQCLRLMKEECIEEDLIELKKKSSCYHNRPSLSKTERKALEEIRGHQKS
ncbi:unnamed protein product [Ranitomeya imitator]|uniref:Amidase domain-containing protein n=1 Tax=Ranitomeya imitator TaxID=111125 RepID=A0ABN9MMY7_9NEOB|nr:unnamed protein product [Ranitomeya imitator]